MKVLMISLDASVLKPESESFSRMKDYSAICDELRIIVLGASGRENKDGNVFVYPTVSNRPLSLFLAYRTGKGILQNNGWIITSQDSFEAGFIAWRLAKKFNLPLEVQLHGDFYGNPYWRKERLINRARFYLGKFILKRADSVRVVSERIRKSIVEINNKIKVIPIFSDFSAETKNADVGKSSGFLILSVGNLVPVKNHKFLIEVFADIKKELPGAKLVIAGDGPLEKDLRFKILDLKLENDVELAGHQKNLADYYRGADIFVHPSLYEGWSRVVIEAAHYGLPIIMADVGLAGEVIKNNESGLLVPVNDKEALKDAIIRLAKDSDLRKKLSENAKQTASALPDKEQYLKNIGDAWQNMIKTNS